MTLEEKQVYNELTNKRLTIEAVATIHRRSITWVQNTLRRAEKKLGAGYEGK